MTLFKYETLAEEEDGITTAQIIGYILLVLIAIMLLFPLVCAIIKIKRMCGHDMSNFSKKDKDKCSDSSNEDEHPENQTVSPSMETAFEDLNNNSILNHQNAEHN